MRTDDCTGWVAADGTCVIPVLPIGTLAPEPPPTANELPNTGTDGATMPILFVLAVAVTVAGWALRISDRRRRA